MLMFSGRRFRYHYRDNKYQHIYQSIEALDRKVSVIDGMTICFYYQWPSLPCICDMCHAKLCSPCYLSDYWWPSLTKLDTVYDSKQLLPFIKAYNLSNWPCCVFKIFFRIYNADLHCFGWRLTFPWKLKSCFKYQKFRLLGSTLYFDIF